jgi:hypothetical protein
MPAPPDPNAPPESIIVGQFSGMRNTVAPERLGPRDLEKAVNVDIDDAGQVRRRRGYELAQSGAWHSIRGPLAGKAFGVKDGTLGIIRADFSFATLGIAIGRDSPVCYTEVNDEVYFSSESMAGVISSIETVNPWGHTDGQGIWFSPVYTPTDTLGEVGGSLLGDPPKASQIEAYKGRIYLAVGKTLWATELFRYHYVDRTRGFVQLEHEITLIMAVEDGLYVGTTGGLYFLQGVFGSFKLSIIGTDAVLAGSGVFVPTELVHPQARSGPVPTGQAAVMMTTGGVIAAFDNGVVHNLTNDRLVFPSGVNAAALFRQDQGANHYVAAVDSAGGPSANARIGDYVDAEIIRASQRGD